MNKRLIKEGALLALCCLVFYCLTGYGGLRSPDEEVVFRVARSIVEGRGFTVDPDLEMIPGFGSAKGADGRLYSVYPPAQSIALAKMIFIAEKSGAAELLEKAHLHCSHYTGNGLWKYLNNVSCGGPEHLRA